MQNFCIIIPSDKKRWADLLLFLFNVDNRCHA